MQLSPIDRCGEKTLDCSIAATFACPATDALHRNAALHHQQGFANHGKLAQLTGAEKRLQANQECGNFEHEQLVSGPCGVRITQPINCSLLVQILPLIGEGIANEISEATHVTP